MLDNRIMLNALEVVLRETNPLAHELYLGAIENLQKRRAAFLRRLETRIKAYRDQRLFGELRASVFLVPFLFRIGSLGNLR